KSTAELGGGEGCRGSRDYPQMRPPTTAYADRRIGATARLMETAGRIPHATCMRTSRCQCRCGLERDRTVYCLSCPSSHATASGSELNTLLKSPRFRPAVTPKCSGSINSECATRATFTLLNV